MNLLLTKIDQLHLPCSYSEYRPTKSLGMGLSNSCIYCVNSVALETHLSSCTHLPAYLFYQLYHVIIHFYYCHTTINPLSRTRPTPQATQK